MATSCMSRYLSKLARSVFESSSGYSEIENRSQNRRFVYLYFFMKYFLLIANIAMISETLFFLFTWQPLLGKQIPSSKLCSLSTKTIPGKLESNR